MNPPEPERVFAAPWQAQAFALAVKLRDAGVFSWDEWATALGHAIAAAGPAHGAHYYEHWLTALEALVVAKAVTDPQELAERRAAWERAIAATPHGAPIRLENDPLAAESAAASKASSLVNGHQPSS